jgi:hypothetical protein
MKVGFIRPAFFYHCYIQQTPAGLFNFYIDLFLRSYITINFYISRVKFLKEHSLFILVLLTCAVLRLLPLFDYQFTYDELSGMERTQFNSFSEVIAKGVKIDAHPALVQLMIYYLTQLFGYITWIIKLPFLLFGFGAIIYAYAFGIRNFSKQSALFAALILSFSLLFVFYAPIARMYISGVFFSIALLFYFFEIFFLKNIKISNYVFLGLFAWLSALNQHINSLFAFTVCASGFLFLNKSNYKTYLLTCTLVVLAYLPHLPVTLYQLGVPGIGRENGGWLEAPEFKVIFSFLETLFGTGRTYILFLICVALAFILNKKIMLDKNQLYLLLIFIFNFLVVYFYSVWRTPVFQYSVMLFSGTAIIMFVCSFLDFKNTGVFYMVFTVVFTALIYKSYFKKDYFHQAVKTIFEYQFERTVYYKKMYGDKNVYPVFFDADNIMKKIYFNKYQTQFDCKISSDSMITNTERVYFKKINGATEQIVSSLRLFSEFIAGLKSDYVVLASSMPQHQAIVEEYFPYLLENTQTQGINFKFYSRKKEDRGKVVKEDQIDDYSSFGEKGHFIYPKSKEVITTNKSFSLKVDSLNEFPFDAKADLKGVTRKEGQVVLVKAILKLQKSGSEVEACISTNDKNTGEQYTYNSLAASDFVIHKDSTLALYSVYFNGTKYLKVKNKASLNCYLWNRGKENFELRDFEIKVIDYWPRKWDFWN